MRLILLFLFLCSFAEARGHSDFVEETISVQERESDEIGILDVRHADRKPGLYLLKDPVHTTTLEPLAALDPESLENFLAKNKTVDGYGVAVINPGFLLSKETKEKLRHADQSLPKVLVIRRPSNFVEHTLDVPMRRQDLVPSSRRDISQATMTDVLDTGAGAIAAFATLPWEAAALVTGGAYVMGGIFYYFLPTHLNHWNRLNIFKMGLWQFATSFVISLAFRSLALSGLGSPELIFEPGWAGVVALSSAVNTMWRPFVGKAIATWRDKYLDNPIKSISDKWQTSSRLYLLGTMMGGPAFIYSTLPTAKEVFDLAGFSVNYGHLGMAFTAALFSLGWVKPTLLDGPGRLVNGIARVFEPINRVWMWPLERVTDGALNFGSACASLVRKLRATRDEK